MINFKNKLLLNIILLTSITTNTKDNTAAIIGAIGGAAAVAGLTTAGIKMYNNKKTKNVPKPKKDPTSIKDFEKIVSENNKAINENQKIINQIIDDNSFSDIEKYNKTKPIDDLNQKNKETVRKALNNIERIKNNLPVIQDISSDKAYSKINESTAIINELENKYIDLYKESFDPKHNDSDRKKINKDILECENEIKKNKK